MDVDLATAILAWLTLACVPVNVVATLLLLKKSRAAPRLRVLRERFLVAAVTTFVVLFFGVIFVNNDQEIPPLDVTATKVITRVAILGLAIVPAVGWIRLYRSLSRPKGNDRKERSV